jgi:hypothetical protein
MYTGLHVKHALSGAFEKVQKATTSFVMAVCPSAWNKSASTDRTFAKIGI